MLVHQRVGTFQNYKNAGKKIHDQKHVFHKTPRLDGACTDFQNSFPRTKRDKATYSVSKWSVVNIIMMVMVMIMMMMMMTMTKHNHCNADDNRFSNNGYMLTRDMSEMTVAARVITQRQ